MIWIIALAVAFAAWASERSPDPRRRQWALPFRLAALGIVAVGLLERTMPEAPTALVFVPVLLLSWLYRVPSDAPAKLLVIAGKLWLTLLAAGLVVHETSATVPMLTLLLGPLVVLLVIAAPVVTVVGSARWAKARSPAVE